MGIVTGKLDRSITGTGSWNDFYQPASGVEVLIFNIILEVDFGSTLGQSDTVLANASIYDGSDSVEIGVLSVSGDSGSGTHQQAQVVTALGLQ